MNLLDVLIPTGQAKSDTTFGEALRMCVEAAVPGVPFVDRTGRIMGRFSLRHAFRMACVSHDSIRGGQLLGDDLDYFMRYPGRVEELMLEPVEGYILEDSIQLDAGAQISQAMERMEDFNTAYLFVVEKGLYQGVITRVGLAKLVLEIGCLE